MNDYILKPVRAAAILTNSYVAGTVIENDHLEDEVIILLDFTIGSLTSAEVKVEFSPDNTNWYQEAKGAYSNGVTTEKQNEHSIAATGKYRLDPIKIKDRYIRVSAKGTGTVTSSSLTISAIIGQDI